MSRVRETTLTFFVTYLSPRSRKLVQPKLIFGRFFKNPSFKIMMSRPEGVESPEVYLFVDRLKIMPVGVFLVGV